MCFNNCIASNCIVLSECAWTLERAGNCFQNCDVVGVAPGVRLRSAGVAPDATRTDPFQLALLAMRPSSTFVITTCRIQFFPPPGLLHQCESICNTWHTRSYPKTDSSIKFSRRGNVLIHGWNYPCDVMSKRDFASSTYRAQSLLHFH